MVEVILKKEVRKLGDRGEIVNVAPGYARNYLIPQGLAMPATSANKQQVAEMKAAGDREAARLTDTAKATAETLDGVTVRIVQKAGDRGQLFGSVTNRDIAEALVKDGYEVDRHQVVLGSPFKRVGDHDVRVHLYRDVNVTVRVEVRAEGREDDLFEDAPAASPMEDVLTGRAEIPADQVVEVAGQNEGEEGEAVEAAEGEASEAAEGETAEAAEATEEVSAVEAEAEAIEAEEDKK